MGVVHPEADRLAQELLPLRRSASGGALLAVGAEAPRAALEEPPRLQSVARVDEDRRLGDRVRQLVRRIAVGRRALFVIGSAVDVDVGPQPCDGDDLGVGDPSPRPVVGVSEADAGVDVGVGRSG